MQPRPVTVDGIAVQDLVDVFRFLMLLFTSYWDAHLDGRLSRFIAPPPDLESQIITMTNDIWRAIGVALRSDSAYCTITSTFTPSDLAVAMTSAAKMLAFVPYAREAGVDVPDDEDAYALLRHICAELGARAEATLEAAAHELGDA